MATSIIMVMASWCFALVYGQKAWSDNFTSNASNVWTATTGILDCPSCFAARPDHLMYGSTGLHIVMNDIPCAKDPTACCDQGRKHCAKVASGHLRSTQLQLFGTFTASMKPSHSPTSDSPSTPSNAFSCFSASYIALTPEKHNGKILLMLP